MLIRKDEDRLIEVRFRHTGKYRRSEFCLADVGSDADHVDFRSFESALIQHEGLWELFDVLFHKERRTVPTVLYLL